MLFHQVLINMSNLRHLDNECVQTLWNLALDSYWRINNQIYWTVKVSTSSIYGTQAVKRLASHEMYFHSESDREKVFTLIYDPVHFKEIKSTYDKITVQKYDSISILNSSPVLQSFKLFSSSLLRRVAHGLNYLLLQGFKISKKHFIQVLRASKGLKVIKFTNCSIQLANSFDFKEQLQGWKVEWIFMTICL